MNRTEPLADPFGRVHRSLRVSLTDRCNLRCRYCMPAAGLPWLPRSELLTDAEMLRVIGIFVGLGIDDVRFTGGEPLLRPGLADIVAGVAAMRPRPRTSLTSNGIGLAAAAARLAAAGLDRVNISLDTVRPDVFRTLARRDRLPAVLAGLAAAHAAGLRPVKVNAVLLRGVNDTEAVPLVEFCLAHGYEPRFIEQMPLDAQRGWSRADMVTAEEILLRLAERWRLTPVAGRGAAPAESFWIDGGPGRVGVIGSVTRPFCGACDRLRLTADGQVRNCLFARKESDLRGPLRAGASDDELTELIANSVAAKKAGHGIDDVSFLQPDRPMSAIGG